MDEPDSTVRFTTTIELGGTTATGFAVPDLTPRTVDVPEDLAGPLAADPAAQATFDGLAPGQRTEWVRWVSGARRPETRTGRVAKTVGALAAARRTR